MLKKITIAILVLLILGSVTLIVYLSLAQSNISFNFLTQLFKQKETGPISFKNPFPIATSTVADQDASSMGTTSSTGAANQANKPAYIEDINIIGLRPYKTSSGLTGLFINQENGHIYALDQQNNLIRQTNTTLPSLASALVAINGKSGYLLGRQVKGLESYDYLGEFSLSGGVGTSSQPGALKYTPLNFQPLNLALSPDNQKIAYLIAEGEKSGLYVSDWSFSKPKKVWTSDLGAWLISWPEANNLFIVDRPAFDYPGQVSQLNLKTGLNKKILSNINGLTISVSPDGNKLLYSKSLLSGFSLYVYNLTTKESVLLGINTLPEKCAWQDASFVYCAVPRNIPSGRYPDDWYQGKISFADDLWKIDVSSKEKAKINTPRGNYDLTQLTIDPTGAWIYTVDKDSQKLQAFNLSNN